MNSTDKYIGLYWQDRCLSFDEYLSFSLGLLKGLEPFVAASGPASCKVGGKTFALDCSELSSRKSELEEIIFDSELNYENIFDSEGRKSTASPLGFSATWEYCQSDKPIFSLSINVGAFGETSPGNSVVCRFMKDLTDLEIKTLFEYLVAACQPEYGKYSSHALDTEMDPEFSYSFSLGLLSFVRRDLAVLQLPKNYTMINKDDGFYLIPDDKTLDLKDDCGIHVLKQIQETLLANNIIEMADEF